MSMADIAVVWLLCVAIICKLLLLKCSKAHDSGKLTKAESHYYLQKVSGFKNRPVFITEFWKFAIAVLIMVFLFVAGYWVGGL